MLLSCYCSTQWQSEITHHRLSDGFTQRLVIAVPTLVVMEGF
jgi:hypothetical protein